jgi:hypothetical protein
MASVATLKQMSHTALTNTTTTTLYTVPGSTKTILKEIVLCNTDTSARTVTIQAGSTTGVADRVLAAVSVGPGVTQAYSFNTVLNAADTVTGGASTGAVVSCLISGVEYA